VHHRDRFGVTRSTLTVRAAGEEAREAGRLAVAHFDRSDSSALRASHASRLTTAPCDPRRERRQSHVDDARSANLELRAVDADPLRRAS
jgi:hypothetical protein